MGTLNDEQYKDLESKFAGKRLARVDMVSVGSLVFRQPSPAEFRMFKTQLLDSSQSAMAYENLFARTVIYPEASEIAKMMEDRPGLSTNRRVITALNRLSGAEDEEEGKD